jgi:type IV pilus assembly protein PilF
VETILLLPAGNWSGNSQIAALAKYVGINFTLPDEEAMLFNISVYLMLAFLLISGCSSKDPETVYGKKQDYRLVSSQEFNQGENSYNPTASLYNTQLAAGYLQRGRIDVALEKIAKAMVQNPRSAAAFHTAALIHEKLGDTEEAEKFYKKALELDAKDPALQNNYGQFLCSVERYNEAEGYFLNAIKNPNYPTPDLAYENAGLCSLRAKDMTKAEQYFREALKLNPNSVIASFQLAKLYYDKGDYPFARVFLQAILKRYQDEVSAPILYLAYQIETALKNASTAELYQRNLLNRYPTSEEALRLTRTKS